jgi:plasmid stabilization system protein ParE
MIVFSPDAIEDIERLRSFLERASPDAAQRAMAAYAAMVESKDILITRIWHGRETRV